MKAWILYRLKQGILLSSVCIGFFGCASDPGNKNYLSEPNLPITGRIDKAQSDTTISTLGTNVLAFGRVRWIENGVERTDYRSGWGWNLWFPYIQSPDDQSGVFVIEKDGSFTWKVPKGQYIIHQSELRDPWDGMHYLPNNKFVFDTNRSANAVCLGTMVIEISSSRDVIGGIRFKEQRIRIDDDCEALSQQFHSRYPDPNFVETKSLMQYNPNMPIPKNIKNFNSFKGIFQSIYPSLMLH